MSSASNDQQAPAGSSAWDLGAVYELVAELLLNPAVRDKERVERCLGTVPDSPVRDSIERFLASPSSQDVAEYTATLELTPPCPLYLGAYMYDEPNSCRGAGASGRNQYMIELNAVYEHFGVGMAGKEELPDFLPVMVEFMAFSIAHKERDGIGLRRRFVENYLQPGLPYLRKAMRRYESVYDVLIEALEFAVEEDMRRLAGDPVWISPEVRTSIPVSLGTPAADPALAQINFRGSAGSPAAQSNGGPVGQRGR